MPDTTIATDKQALRPGDTAKFANYTSFDNGINGIFVDIARFKSTPIHNDFLFKVGNTNDSSTWSDGPQPQEITRRPGQGVDGSDRVVLTWSDHAVEKQWLQVTVLPTDNTALAKLNVHYWDNAFGESGNSTINAFMDGVDFARSRDNMRNFLNQATITDKYDYNRDSFVDGTDIAIARDNVTNLLTPLKLISAPGTGTQLPLSQGG